MPTSECAGLCGSTVEVPEDGSITFCHGCSEGARIVNRNALKLAKERIADLETALREISDLAPTCDHCTDLDTEEQPNPKRPITHETTLFGMPIYLCAEHAPDRVASYRKAESKGSGKQPAVVPYVEANRAIEIARRALGEGGE